jgi:acyl carrier protein
VDARSEQRLTEIFRGLFGLPSLVLRDELTARDVPGWDSLNHVSLMVEVEGAFGVRFSSDEIAALQCVGDLKALIERKRA